jgi:peroxiredoxin
MNRVKKVVLVITLASVLTVGLAMFGCSSDSTAATPTQDTNVGSLAPDFQFYDSEERLVSLSDLRGRPIILNFWETRCQPCVSEMPYLQQVHEEWSDNGLVLLAINMGDTSSQVKEFLQSHELSLPVLLDTKRHVAARYNIWAVPTTFFIDKEGTIQAVRVGAFPNEQAIYGDLEKIMT